jgi:dipeptidyl aminopeptidase/acylaminoacyl peptidase
MQNRQLLLYYDNYLLYYLILFYSLSGMECLYMLSKVHKAIGAVRLGFTWVLLILVSLTLQAEATPIADIDLFFTQEAISDPQLSPDGKRVAYLQSMNDVPNLVVASVDGSGAHQVTFSQSPIQSFEWSNGGKHLFFLRDDNGNENYGLFRVAIGGKKRAPLEDISQSPNARVSYFRQTDARGESVVVALNIPDPQIFDLYSIDLSNGSKKRVFRNRKKYTEFFVSKQGELKAAVRMLDDSALEMYSFSKISIHGKKIFTTKANESIEILKLSKDEKSIYLSSNQGDVDKSSLRLVNLSTGEQSIIDKDPLDESDYFDSLFDKDARLLMTSYYSGYKRDYVKDDDFNGVFENIKNKLTGYEIKVINISKNSDFYLIEAGRGDKPNGYYIYNKISSTLSLFYQNSPKLNPQWLGEKKSIHYKARDGVKIQAYLTLPPKGLRNNSSKTLPLVVIPHGGPWARYYYTFESSYISRLSQLLANRGYVVLQPNFRSSTGFGKRFFALGHRQWGTGSMQHDITDGVSYLIEQGVADKHRVAIVGGSYGGYAALAGATFTPDVYSAVISICGPSSLVTLTESFPAYYRPLLEGSWFSWVGDPQNKKDRMQLQAQSPINYVDNIKAPVLLIQGANDPRVKQSESEIIAKKMVEKKLSVEYILAEDEGHGFVKHNNRLAMAHGIEQFLAQHIGGRKTETMDVAIKKHLVKLKVDVNTL